MLSKAIILTATRFEQVYNKGDRPYILHCLTVMNDVMMANADDDVIIAALMHDLIEDTSCTRESLLEEGFSRKSVGLIELLSHEKDVSYFDYIEKISLSYDATLIKMADLRHNSDIRRVKGFRQKDFNRIEKYNRAYSYLSGNQNAFEEGLNEQK